ncbi:hypothetical protein Q428_07845 [Fervidicella metallireducens AeB]|uniref:serine-type D-Ala-D-Ala carboxypeptidase n=1 Tax=Fervidicella metallireducens AeB TaxID=1403537 RepID=A0A017RUY8_9CLOT|nr:D-alanyl-D-alanine carboxypeptidase family protein [Fervidicella metallireducens]EYE88487.1 hypothetical protein Q428_07845 [Fervidicella metallireducens AeB]
MKKKICILVLLVFSFINTNIVYADSKTVNYKEDLNLNCKAAILIEANTGRVLYEKNSDAKLPLASITKLMTYLVFKEYLEKLNISDSNAIFIKDNNIKVPESASKLGLKKNDTITVKELIDSLLIISANDSAEEIRIIVEKDGTDFIYNMNLKAKELGLTKTQFYNVTGLTEGKENNIYNTSSARDISELAKNIIKKYPEILNTTSKKSVVIKNKVLYNTNGALGKKTGVDGLKTGHTSLAGYCLVATEDLLSKNGNGYPFRLISVVLGSSSDYFRVKDSLDLLNFGEQNFFNNIIVKKDKKFDFENKYYKEKNIQGICKKDLYVLAKKNEIFKINAVMNENLNYNIKKGDIIGKVIITNSKDEVVKENQLYAIKDYKSVFLLKRWYFKIMDYFKINL